MRISDWSSDVCSSDLGLSHGKLLCCFRMRERGGVRRWNQRGKGKRMKRLHVHVGVENLATSIRFYSTMFGAEPTVLKQDYAKWMLEDPRVDRKSTRLNSSH